MASLVSIAPMASVDEDLSPHLDRHQAQSDAIEASEDHRSQRLSLPWDQMTIILLLTLLDGLSIAIFFPILPFMAQFMLQLPSKEEHNLGFFVGALTTSYCLGQMISAPFWGSLSDRWARRPVILLSLLFWSLFMFAFSVATSFWMAVVIRFAQGLASGFNCVSRAHLADVTNETNRAKAFALCGAMYGFGDVFGPPLGGFLADPENQFPAVFNTLAWPIQSLLHSRPYFLPNGLLACFGLVAFVLSFFMISEKSKAESVDMNSATITEREGDDGEPVAWLDMFRRYPLFRIVCLVSCVWGGVISAYDAVVPLWAKSQLGTSPAELATIQASCGIISIVASVYLIPKMVDKLGSALALAVSFLAILLCVSTPLFDIALGLQHDMILSRGVLVATYSFKSLAVESCFANLGLLLIESVPSHVLGTAQGIGGSAPGLGFALGPLVGPSLFAWSSAPNMAFPGALPFIFLALLTIVCALLSNSLHQLSQLQELRGTEKSEKLIP